MFLQTKKTCLPITKDILLNIIRAKPISLQDLNVNTIFKITWAGFLHIDEFTYINADLKNRKIFSTTKLTRSDIIFL